MTRYQRHILMYLLVSLMLLVLLAACASPAAPAEPRPEPTEPAAEEAEGRTLILGDITDDPGEVIEGTQPLADYLAENLSDYGITGAEVRIATSIDEMASLLASGEVDLYFDSVYPATIIADAAGTEPFLRRWRRGIGEYYTIFFVRQDSDIETIEDLNGRTVAFDSPYSTSGFAVPSSYLIEEGLAMTGLASYNEDTDPDSINFVFSFDDENTVQWVLQGLVDAGATDSGSFEFFAGDLQDEFRIVAETESVPRQVAVARADMDPELKAAITELLIGIDETPEGPDILDAFGSTTKFDEFPEGIETTMSRMREIRDIVQEIDLP